MTVNVPATPAGATKAWVAGRGCLAFTLAPGQDITILDSEGLQAAILLVKAGAASPALHGYTPAPDVTIDAMRARVEGGDTYLLDKPEWAQAEAYVIFDDTGAAGRSATVRAASCSECLLLAPGSRLSPGESTCATGLQLHLPAPPGPPACLASPKLDITIRAATALAYTVQAGDYIQIVDLHGKQCSDFLAFDAALLATGVADNIDPTTTRTLMGHAIPQPGLHAKYFDSRMQPLVEIIRDTVGRHDAFLLACTPKYYADFGYPGHANCTDNFNAALAPYGVAPRAGWPALNFFYNTAVRADGSIASDEPWSRPGDYVLVRAMTSLVCASSSCADDVDAANAWQPTDIQLRVYDKSCDFTKGMVHRMTPDSAPEFSQQSGFHCRTASLTRSFVEYKGFWTPSCFTGQGPIAEYWACRERAACIDLSALRKFEVTGPDAETLLQLAVTRDIRKLAVGQIVYSAVCYPSGGMLDDATIFRLGAQNFRFVCGDPYCGIWLRTLAEQHHLRAWVRSSTSQLNNLALQGPRSRAILAAILATPAHQPNAAELGWFRFTIGTIEKIPVLVSRTGYTGELGYEIWCHPSTAPEVWDAVWQAGQPFGLLPMGLSALDMLRIEAGLVFAGSEFCDQTDPFEAGIGFTVPAKKSDPFIGDAALARRRAHPSRKLVGLTIDSQDDVAHGDPIYAQRAQVGIVTSAVRSPVLRQHIALARIDVSALDSPLEIGKLDGQQKRLPVAVCSFPHYDPEKTRVKTPA